MKRMIKKENVNLNWNQRKEIPKEVWKLEKIEDVSFIINKISHIQLELIQLKKLKGLYLFNYSAYNFHISNESSVNQEVIISFETTNKYSVISDLKIWLNLELQ